MVNEYVKVAEAGVSIPIGYFLKDQLAPTMPDLTTKAIVSIVGWILILVNTLLGAGAFAKHIATKVYEAKIEVEVKKR
jgi:uncharacterized membrane protein